MPHSEIEGGKNMKFIALLLALVMALSCAGALAEQTQPFTTCTADCTATEELIGAWLEEQAGDDAAVYLPSVLSLVNHLSVRAVMGPEGAQAELLLKDSVIATIVGGMADGQFVLVSDLFPSYAITLSPEAVQNAGVRPEMDDEAVSRLLEDHIAHLFSGIKEKIGQPQVGEFVFEGVTFQAKLTADITTKELTQLVLAEIKALLEEEALAPLAAAVERLDISGLKRDIASLNTMDEEEMPETSLIFYVITDPESENANALYMTIEMSDEEKTLAFAGGNLSGKMYAHLLFGDSIYASKEAMRQAAMEGSVDAAALDLAVIPTETGAQIEVGIADGTPMGIKADFARTESGMTGQMTLYSHDALQLTIRGALTAGGEITASLSTEGTIPLDYEAMAADEDGILTQRLAQDVQSFGLPTLLGNAATVMPDEVVAFVTMLSTAMEANQETVIEGVDR